MGIRHAAVFVALFAWQVGAPLPRDERPARWRLGLGAAVAGFGYEVRGTDCDGRPTTYDERVTYSAVAVHADAWSDRGVRVSAAADARTLGAGRGSAYRAGLLAWETSPIGLGAGWTFGPEHPSGTGLSAYLRLGRDDRTHLRAELRPVTSTPGVPGWARAGLAFNQGRKRGSTWYFGLAAATGGPTDVIGGAVTATPRSSPAAFADVGLQAGETSRIILRTHVGYKLVGIAAGYERAFH